MSLATFEEWMDKTLADGYVTCPMCAVDTAWEESWLGVLGTRVHFRCRCCGGQWSLEDGEDVNC